MSKLIALDAGHGLYTAGKRCLKSIDPNQTREWYLNDRIMDRAQVLLSEYDCDVLRVDDTTGKKDIPLSARTKAANNAGADAYVAMHHNADIDGGPGGGTVVFYYSTKAERREQAQKLYNYITDETKLYGNRSQRVVKKGFYVLKHTKAKSFLVENGFMDSTTDTPIILTQAHAEKTAQGLVAFLVDELLLEKKKCNNGANTEPQRAYKTYTVRKGDNLIKIGERFSVNYLDIIRLNNIPSPYTIYPGQILKIALMDKQDIYYPAYAGPKTTLSAAMKSLGIDNSYSYRKQIAKANNISAYVGTATQNTQMYNLLVAGLLKK